MPGAGEGRPRARLGHRAAAGPRPVYTGRLRLPPVPALLSHPRPAHQQISSIGIGLYIGRQIAERHGGTIEIEQPNGKGSIFVLRLPIDNDTR